MSTFLCPTVPALFMQAAILENGFTVSELVKLREFSKREKPPLGQPKESCTTALFFGFFFDGTKNSYRNAEQSRTHSNVARLYDCYPGQSVLGVLPEKADWEFRLKEDFTNFFKVYIPGVATRFDEVNDDGTSQAGAASGAGGEARIAWALLQAVNNLHRYFFHTPMISSVEAKSTIKNISLSPFARHGIAKEGLKKSANPESVRFTPTSRIFNGIWERLWKATALHRPQGASGRPAKTDPGIVTKIHISIFGFSRGATEARAFATWLHTLCMADGDGHSLSLGGFPAEFDFIGLFDTVASIGLGNTLGNTWYGNFNGHQDWADSEGALRIPEGVRCLHLVAAHELRRSFPLDSVAIGKILPPNCEEVIFPGVHSDIGGGYAPREHGKGTDLNGDDMLSRVPLVYMYRAARLAGVPLKLEHASKIAKERFSIALSTIAALNAYLDACTVQTGTITAIMRAQMDMYRRWRLERRTVYATSLEKTPSFLRASTFDQNDLHSANLEFEEEIDVFREWNRLKAIIPAYQPPGFHNEHLKEWEEISTWWDGYPALSDTVTNFFDEFVHDSRAAFKLAPGSCDSPTKQLAQLAHWARGPAPELRKQAELVGRGQGALPGTRNELPPDPITPEQRLATEEFKRTGAIPRMITSGREPFGGKTLFQPRAGYLRFRKVYAGGDDMLVSQLNRDEVEAKPSLPPALDC
jgi:hypothetical protein